MIVIGECSSGFSIPALGLVVLTEHEIFGARRRSLRRPKYHRGAPVNSFTDLAVNDLVVHEDHGIGRYLGLKTMKIDQREADFLLLEYSEGNQLYLPVERLELISKYLGGEESAARLDRLGGAAWQRVKESVRAALREMAEELLKLYAQRAVAEGHAFSPDTPWQREFDAAFRFEETPDQLRAIKDVKRDMLSERPMDRLVAGDVGYGKTEVALRAAFKAVADGRQVAVLVPTTVLAHQHWSTFVDRFSPFPARVELLSRFRSAKEQKAVVEGLKQGTVDVVIGTHRLLSKDVAFKDLGLLVVDEEHRFGVAHKERMKQLRTSVDVLALTATPIPRTLYMSLSGVRDMSVIETPPIDRLPIETVVRRFSKSVIKEALTRELERGGQIFFVHNRIQSLASMANLIQSLVPEARVVIGHGQMKERELEATMVKFVTGQADVLVSTAIVESGLDIPASNTIIVNRADRFGLAQLYQLRGRVGRERQQAYCYLLVPADGRVDEQAQKRLRVLQELTELGSGFKLAMRDLEIRGAGNLLGAQQHGHIAAVGYDLYSKLLAEAVRELSGQPTTAAVDPVISAPAEGFLPEEYVPEVNQRLALYKRLAGAGDEETVADIRTELADRFGPPPLEVEQLLDVVRIRLAARRLGIEKVEIGDARALLTFAASTPMEPGKLLAAIRDSKGRLKMKRDYTLEATVARGDWPRVRDSVTRCSRPSPGEARPRARAAPALGRRRGLHDPAVEPGVGARVGARARRGSRRRAARAPRGAPARGRAPPHPSRRRRGHGAGHRGGQQRRHHARRARGSHGRRAGRLPPAPGRKRRGNPARVPDALHRDAAAAPGGRPREDCRRGSRDRGRAHRAREEDQHEGRRGVQGRAEESGDQLRLGPQAAARQPQDAEGHSAEGHHSRLRDGS
jgi:transcription-repair coupling factor (superfamily II helicase)